MSGHSKWKQIKYKKAAADIKKGALFSRLIRNLTLAAKEGAAVETNFKLRVAIDQARAANMPKDNIERAIARGSGQDGADLREVLYEGYGPAGVAILIKCITDNPNRSVSDVRQVLQKHGGSLAESGAVRWNFEQKGVMRLELSATNDKEALELAAIDADADDVREEEDGLLIVTEPKNLQTLKDVLEKQNIKSEFSEIEWLAKNTVALSESDGKKLDELTNTLDEMEDVQDYYTNAE